jgi:7-cyano-7-deazaguanine reductase
MRRNKETLMPKKRAARAVAERAPMKPTMTKIPKRVSTRPSRRMETFPNPKKGRDYEIEMTYPEFTCLCPMTGQPDFASVRITYIPDAVCVELKSLRNYLWSYRNHGAFHEAVTNRIADDLIRLMQPRWLHVDAEFQVRGGVHTTVRVEHSSEGR